MALAVALGLAALLLLGIVAAVVAIVQWQARARAAAERPVVPDRVEVVSAAWQERDRFQVHVRLSRADGAPLRGWHGIRLVDPRPGGYGALSDYLAGVSNPIGPTATHVDVIAVQGLPRPPQGALTLQIEGVTPLPAPYRSPVERFLFGPDPPRVRSPRYSLAGGTVTLPAPKTTVISEGKRR